MAPASQIVCSCSADLGAWASLRLHVAVVAVHTMTLAVHNQCKPLTKIKLLFDVCRLAAQESGCEGLAGCV